MDFTEEGAKARRMQGKSWPGCRCLNSRGTAGWGWLGSQSCCTQAGQRPPPLTVCVRVYIAGFLSNATLKLFVSRTATTTPSSLAHLCSGAVLCLQHGCDWNASRKDVMAAETHQGVWGLWHVENHQSLDKRLSLGMTSNILIRIMMFTCS